MRRDKKNSGQRNFRDHTLIAPSARVMGDIEFNGGLHIQGEVEGNITVGSEGGQLVIGETGVVRGEIRVPRITINGRVEGDVNATEHLELASKAQVEGNVFYVTIEMLIGARVNGKLVRLDEERRNLPAPEKPGDARGDASPATDNS
ncbi:bactofilin family protein [Alloalcanivorax gelatiniphagus]|uniref:Polymer-forming cytoskeletal protein n=1 Tax=Alloalcanivorax gelatiniphagus TaxID=1194167 RepID=A0ABY2XR13_9GAMM|nr:polymer-forming cytoskeletal protein [Alloalcanivorax gelatiniphagus]TMW15345.1 polymer-forming cytoskeletal protein [Alloalcanivorax gelatiniphagus]